MKGVTFNYKKSFRIVCQVAYTAEGIYTKKGGPYDIPFTEIIKRAKEKPEIPHSASRGRIKILRKARFLGDIRSGTDGEAGGRHFRSSLLRWGREK
jgi:hypothetical protein